MNKRHGLLSKLLKVIGALILIGVVFVSGFFVGHSEGFETGEDNMVRKMFAVCVRTHDLGSFWCSPKVDI